MEVITSENYLGFERRITMDRPYFYHKPDIFLGLTGSHTYWPNSSIKGRNISGHGISLMLTGSIRFWSGIPTSNMPPKALTDNFTDLELDAPPKKKTSNEVD